jgi:predicted TIM-barrel fold metal-dependent hydrolase
MTPGAQPPPIAPPREIVTPPRWRAPAGACDCHAHLFGPARRFPYAEGRGYTPAEAPLEKYLALLDHLGLQRGIVVQGNAHGYDNSVLLDALKRAQERLRGVAITDQRVDAAELRRWHRVGMRGLRFHIHAPGQHPGYTRGVGLDVLQHFRPVLRELGWVAQFWCDWRSLEDNEAFFRLLGGELPVVIDHVLSHPASLGTGTAPFQALRRLVADGSVYAKLSAPYRQSTQAPRYEDAASFHRELAQANPDRILWGSDWPHPQVDAANMPDDGVLLDLLADWLPDAGLRTRILVDNPQRLFWAA